jgi:cell wall-associated NlpC family hydrolase
MVKHDIVTEAEACSLRWGRSDGALVSRAAVVAEARSWIDTPFAHQHDMKGHAVDCGGLIRGVSVALGLIPANYRDLAPQRLRGYARTPDGDLGMQLCDFYWNRIAFDDARPGDVILVRWCDGPPQHGAILGDYPHGGLSMIHALGPRHPNKVIEHRLMFGTDGRAPMKLVAAYSLPGVE